MAAASLTVNRPQARRRSYQEDKPYSLRMACTRRLASPLDGLGAPDIGLVGARGQFVLDLERHGQRDGRHQFHQQRAHGAVDAGAGYGLALGARGLDAVALAARCRVDAVDWPRSDSMRCSRDARAAAGPSTRRWAGAATRRRRPGDAAVGCARTRRPPHSADCAAPAGRASAPAAASAVRPCAPRRGGGGGRAAPRRA